MKTKPAKTGNISSTCDQPSSQNLPQMLITENFKINSGNSATKRKREEAFANNYKLKMNPHSLDLTRLSPHSPVETPSKRRVLGEISNTPLFLKNSPLDRIKTPLIDQKSPLIDRNISSPLTSRSIKRSSKISRVFQERSKYKMSSNKENSSPLISETFVKLDLEEDTRDCSFSSFQCKSWTTTKLDFSDTLPAKAEEEKEAAFVPEKDFTADLDPDMETLHDLEEEFDADNFDHCTKYEVISTDSPNIISRGRPSTSRKVTSKTFDFGAPLSDNEPSTSFNNKPNPTATRMLNFDSENFEFTSPPVKKPSNNLSVKKSLKFTETPTKNPLRHECSDSSIGSMSSDFRSPARLRIFPSESTASMESGFVSEFEEPFLELEEPSNSPKFADFNELLSGTIKENIPLENVRRPNLLRSLSFNPEASKARVNLFSQSQERKSVKRLEREIDNGDNKRRKSNCESPMLRPERPVLQRAFSENNASIMSALARSAVDPDLIGDFSQPFVLPLTRGDHEDLKSISCETLAKLIQGEYGDDVEEFQVIDCRYPYEYEGGHILGAHNLYTRAQVLELVSRPLRRAGVKRSILVFHCEFSLERGPKLSRFLRSSDRAKNSENYPSLHYPEIYLLHEGYRAFYQRHPELCTPNGYTAMLDPKHKHLLRRHRSKK